MNGFENMISEIRNFIIANPKAIDITITIICIIAGWKLVLWLDRNVFNRGRYK